MFLSKNKMSIELEASPIVSEAGGRVALEYLQLGATQSTLGKPDRKSMRRNPS